MKYKNIAFTALLALFSSDTAFAGDSIDDARRKISDGVVEIKVCGEFDRTTIGGRIKHNICCAAARARAEASCSDIPIQVVNECIRRYPFLGVVSPWAAVKYCTMLTTDIRTDLVKYCKAKVAEQLKAVDCPDVPANPGETLPGPTAR